ncbi:hypothetical protein TSAR_009274, partial [Trichomalopsis sarcophagae]
LEVLLDLPPLDRVVRACAFKASSRLVGGENCKTLADKGLATEILPVIAEVGCDRLTERIQFAIPYEERMVRRRTYPNESGKVRYTDGSKTANGVEAGVWEKGSAREIVCSLNQHATVFQAEIRAIMECVGRVIKEGECGSSITIC